MGHNDHINLDLHEAIEDLLGEGHIEKPSKEYGVAQQVISQGEDSLTPKQRVVWEQGVLPLLKKRGEELKIQDIVNRTPD
jgi:hypothetical protein